MPSPSAVPLARPRSSVWNRWYDRLHRRADRMIGPRLRPRLGPDTLTQNALLAYWRAWERLAHYNSRQLFGWLLAVMRNNVLRTLSDIDPNVDPLKHDPIDPRPGPQTPVDEAELYDLVLQAIERLDERERAVLLLRRDEHLSHAEIGERLGITANHSAVLHYRAIVNLRELLTIPDRPIEDRP